MTTATEPAATLADQFFRMMDTNHDGVLSRADFDTAAAQMARGFGGGANDPNVERLLDAMHDWISAIVEHADRDHDDAVTPEEYRSALADPRSRKVLAGYADTVLEALFEFADRDRDGRLGRADLENAYAALNTTDHSAFDAFLDADDGISRAALHRMTHSIYGSTNKLAEQFFDAMDFNRDGMLSRADFDTGSTTWARGFGREPDDPKVQGYLGLMRSWFDSLAEEMGKDKDGGVTLTEFLGALANPATSEKLAGYTAPIVDAMFAFADRGGDGRLDRDEMSRAYATASVTEHSALDAYMDADGGIDRANYRRMINDMLRPG